MIDVSAYIYTEKLKDIKRRLGSKVKHLSNRRSVEGDRAVDAGIVTPEGYQHFEFTMPYVLSDITESDFERLEELIKSKM